MYSRKYTTSILQALLVTFLWSTSFIIIKKGLVSIPPLTFAGLRYFLDSLFLSPFVFKKKYRIEIQTLSKKKWSMLLLLGLVFYVFTQGTQFIGLSLLPSTTVSLMLNFTPVIVVILSIIFICEKPLPRQILGILLFIIGALIYFLPISDIGKQYIGLVVMTVSITSNAIASVLGRSINRNKENSPFTITFISMSFGSILLLSTGLIIEGIPRISIMPWIALIWLSSINTAFAFTLWNRTLRHLTAMVSSIINGTMLIQIAILAWIFLGERPSWTNVGGMIIASIGAIFVQLRYKEKEKN